MLSDMQQGSRPGKQCISAVLKKVLSHDILRLKKQSAAFIENDAVGRYDCLVNTLILMLLTKLGLPSSVADCLGVLWDSAVHLIKTIYGIADATYFSSVNCPLYGPGQGSTCGPLFWLICYWIILSSLDPSISAASFCSALQDVIVEITVVSFVDNTSLGVTSAYQPDPESMVADNNERETRQQVGKLQHLAQHWERLLFTTGGALNLQESHWYLMSWLWHRGILTLATNLQRPFPMSHLQLWHVYCGSPVLGTHQQFLHPGNIYFSF